MECPSPELRSSFDSEELPCGKIKNLSIFHDLSTSDSLPESVSLDHCYAKAWNLHPEADHVRPAKILFMKEILFNPVGLENLFNVEDEIDVETVEAKPLPGYDMTRAKVAMRECERFCNVNQDDSELEDWEEKIPKATWSASQKNLFNKVLSSLQSERLALLAYQQNSNEPILRRLAIDKMAGRIRFIFSSVSWDMPLLQWLHQVLCDNLPQVFLAQYLDVLQTLKSKAPTLIDKMLIGSKNIDSLQHLLKRPWDPIASYLNQHKVKRLPKNPLIVWTPGDPAYSCVGHSRRMKFWHTHFSNLGKLITVNPQVTQGVSIGESLEAIITAVRYEVMELKLNFPNRPIILVGWTIGALIACQVALIEPISAIVCLGFPLTGVNGSRGDLDDPLLENRTPTLFVIGQKASMCSIDDIEDFRERMRAESGLVVIGGADDHLRVCRVKKQLEGINQNIVDRCIVDEMYNFLLTILSHNPLINPDIIVEKVKFEAPKRKRKSAAMLDPPYPDPTVTVKKRRNKRNSCFPYIGSFSGNVSPSSPGSTTTETSSTTSSAGESFIDKVLKTNGRGVNTSSLTGNISLQNIEEAKRRKSMAPPLINSGFSSFTPIDLPPPAPEKGNEASFFSQQLGLPVISPNMANNAASTLVVSSILSSTSCTPTSIFASPNSLICTTTTSSQQIVHPTFQNVPVGTPSTGGRLVLPKGNSPPGLSLNIGSLSSLSSFRQTQASLNQPIASSITPSSHKLGGTRNIRPKATSPQLILPSYNPLFGKRLSSSTTSGPIMLKPQKVFSNPQQSSNLSYLTMANPMLSNILGTSLGQITTTKSPTPAIQKPSYDLTPLPAPITLVKHTESPADRIRTYMRTPQKTANIVRTTTYVKAPANKSSNIAKDDYSGGVTSIPGQSLLSHKGTANSNVVQVSTNSSKGNGSKKLQVITFLKPTPMSSSVASKETKTMIAAKNAVPQATTQQCKLSSPENASGALRLISSAIRVAEQKHNINSTENIDEQSRKISLAKLSSDFQSEYLKSVVNQSSSVEDNEVQIIESASTTTMIIEEDEIAEFEQELEEDEEKLADDDMIIETELATQSLMMEPITTDSAPITFVTSSTGVVDSAITDRLSHLSAGTQEAILALTQLSELP